MNYIYGHSYPLQMRMSEYLVLGLEKKKWEDGHLVQSMLMFLFLTLIPTTFKTNRAYIDIQYTSNACMG